MRPIAKAQSALRCPLNEILSTETNVRVLRTLALSPVPVAVSEVAVQAALQASGVARACMRLEDLGIVEAVGRGRNRQYWMPTNQDEMSPAPIGAPRAVREALVDLFKAEHARGRSVLDAVKMAFRVRPDTLRAAWIEGPVARGVDTHSDAIVVGALIGAADAELTRNQLWQSLWQLQHQFDVVIELRTMTEADLRTADEARISEFIDAIPIVGAPPLHLISGQPAPALKLAGTGVRSHSDMDRAAKRLAAAVATRLRTDPSIAARARRYVEERIPVASSGELLELQEWRQVLMSMSIPRLRRFLVQDDARATRLRQSMPFFGVLSELERTQILAEQNEPNDLAG